MVVLFLYVHHRTPPPQAACPAPGNTHSCAAWVAVVAWGCCMAQIRAAATRHQRARSRRSAKQASIPWCALITPSTYSFKPHAHTYRPTETQAPQVHKPPRRRLRRFSSSGLDHTISQPTSPPSARDHGRRRQRPAVLPGRDWGRRRPSSGAALSRRDQ